MTSSRHRRLYGGVACSVLLALLGYYRCSSFSLPPENLSSTSRTSRTLPRPSGTSSSSTHAAKGSEDDEPEKKGTVSKLLKGIRYVFSDKLIQPFYYKLEAKVASQSIPSLEQLLSEDKSGPSSPRDRWSLKDHVVTEDSYDHSLWDGVLKRHVTTDKPSIVIDGIDNMHTVDYDGIAGDPDFVKYLQQLQASIDGKENAVDNLPKADQLAFWMNAYNALCIAKILHYQHVASTTIESINELSNQDKSTGLSMYAGPVWEQPVVFNIQKSESKAVSAISLNTIEHSKLRKLWNEPLIHACIVCASASCPNLRASAFTASGLSGQMESQFQNWMQHTSKGLLSPTDGDKRLVTLSRIFLWFREDFLVEQSHDSDRDLLKWIAQHIRPWDPTLAQQLVDDSTNYCLRYFSYSWKINRTP